MPKEKKEKLVLEIQEILSRSTIAIATDYRGLSVAQITELRRRLRDKGILYRVVKNTLASFAAQRAGRPGLVELLKGPIALALGYREVTEPARALAEYLRLSKTTLAIRGGLLDNRVLSAEEVLTLAALPPMETLVATLIGAMQAPLVSLTRVMSAPLQTLAGVLQARIHQLGGGDDHP